LSVTQSKSFSIGDPVNFFWLNFDIQALPQEARLKWSVADDMTQKEYRIEKSGNGSDFFEIGAIMSQKQQNASYHFTDKNVQPGTVYYRIKVIEDANNYAYSMVSKIIIPQAEHK